ncbi:MAG: nitroreductase family protein [Chloroflexota bacterium]
MQSQDFWDYLDRLVARSPVVIDRPLGSAHPRFPELVYPLDYGYLQGTTTVDEGGIDVWVGSQPGRTLEAVVLTVDLHKRDAELKLLLGCSPAETDTILDFLNGVHMRAWLVPRHGDRDWLRWLRSRRSVRRFRSQAVPEAALQRILQAATWAPSAHNQQPWRFVVLQTPQARARLAESMSADFQSDLLAEGLPLADAQAQAARSRARICAAPAAILLCLEEEEIRRGAGPAPETLMAVQSAALAGGHLLLAAHAEGLGAVWLCAPLFAQPAARQALDLPESWQPQALFLLGYPARQPGETSRRPLEEVVLYV